MSLKGFSTCSQNLSQESARNMYYRIICFAEAFKMVGFSDRTYASYRSEPLKLAKRKTTLRQLQGPLSIGRYDPI